MSLQDAISFTEVPVDTAGRFAPQRQVLVYFITGNPGLIEYYREFLTRIHAKLTSKSNGTAYQVFGASLPGFELQDADGLRTRGPPYSLQEQIALNEQLLQRTAAKIQGRRYDLLPPVDDDAVEPLPVILVGHSVGAYILLELIARRQAAQKHFTGGNIETAFEIKGGICLFPTVVDIAKSPTGRKVAVGAPHCYVALRDAD